MRINKLILVISFNFFRFTGSGGYADDNIGAVSTTGYGDAILRFNVAHRILSAVEYGKKQNMNMQVFMSFFLFALFFFAFLFFVFLFKDLIPKKHLNLC